MNIQRRRKKRLEEQALAIRIMLKKLARQRASVYYQRNFRYFLKRRNVEYIRIPKCASTTTLYLLQEAGILLYGPEDCLLPSPLKNGKTIVIIRNPLNRAISAWGDRIYQKKHFKQELERFGLRAGMDFLEYVKRIQDIPDDIAEQHFRSQSWFLKTTQNPVYGHVEKMAESWRCICDEIGLAYKQPPRKKAFAFVRMGKINVNTKEASRYLEKRYADDYELWEKVINQK